MPTSAMQGYDAEKAVAFMMGKLDKSEFKPLAAQAESLVRAAIEADFGYMRRSGVLGEDGLMGDAFYDDDEAFEYILDAVAAARHIGERQMDALAAFVDQYMELQEQFMTEAGLIDWA